MTEPGPAQPWTLTRHEREVLRDVLAAYEADSLTTLLWAASSAPAARQRRTVITVLLALALRSPSRARRPATPADLPGLVDAALGKVPRLRQPDDWVPPDPALEVLVDYLDQAPLRLHPGDLERPLDLLPTAFGYAHALDEFALGLLGFSCTDLIAITVALLRKHNAAFAARYRPAPDVTLDTPPTLDEAEFHAAREYLAAFDSVDLIHGALECHARPDDTSVEQVRRAIEWMTAAVEKVPLQCSWPISVLGPALLLRSGTTVLPVPAAHLLSGLEEMLRRLCLALDKDAVAQHFGPDWARLREAAETRWASFAELQLHSAVAASGTSVIYPVRLPEDDRNHAMLITGSRHVFLVALCSGLSPDTTSAGVEDARHRLATLPSRLWLSIPPTDEMLPADAVISEVDGVTWVDGWATGLPFALPRDGQPVLLAPDTAVTPIVAVAGVWAGSRIRKADDPVLSLLVPELRQLFEDALHALSDSQEAWEFLESFAALGGDEHGPGWQAMHQFSLLDSWEVWKALGALSPAWTPEHAVVQTRPADSVVHWDRAAEQGATARLLAALELPPLGAWNSRHRLEAAEDRVTRETGVSTSVLTQLAHRVVVWAVPEADLAVLADLQLGVPGLSREGLVAIADSLRQQLTTMSRCPEAWLPWQQAHGEPVLVVVRAAPTESGLPQILGRPSYLEISFPGAEQPPSDAAIWHLLGDGISSILCQLLDPEPDRPTGADQDPDEPSAPEPVVHEHRDEPCAAAPFAAHWTELPPTLVSFAPSHPAGSPGMAATPLSELRDRRAQRRVMRGLRGRLSPGEHPIAVALATISPHALEVLGSHCSRFDRDALLVAAAAELERAFAERLLAQDMQATMARQGRGFDNLGDIVEGNSDQVRLTRGLEFLTEFVLAHGSAGGVRPDRRDVSELRDIASWMVTTAMGTATGGAGLQPSAIDVDAWGNVAVRRTGPGPVDLRAWAALLHLSPIARIVEAASEDPAASPAAETDPDAAGYWSSLNRALVECLGTTAEALFATLATVSDWQVPPEPHGPVATVDKDELVAAVLERNGAEIAAAALAANAPGHERGHAAAAVDLLTLRAEEIRQEGLSYWLLERRAHRLALRPLISLQGRLVLLPRRAHATITQFQRYLVDSRAPWPPGATPQPILELVAERRQELNRQLERETAAVCRRAGLQARANIDKGPYPRAAVELPGEVDVLAVDEERGVVWVIECKHMYEPFSPPEMARQVAAMYGIQALAEPTIRLAAKQPRHVERLLAKAAVFVARPAAAAWLVARERDTARADAQLAKAQGREWTVVPVMVTRHLQVAAFYHRPEVIWTEIDWLPHLLRAPDLPAPGPWLPLLAERAPSG